MDLTSIYMLMGFFLAAYAVVSNDSIQTLGTFLSANSKVRWWVLWLSASVVMVATLGYGWYINDGDMAWGRLEEIPLPTEFNIWYVIAPASLLILTRFGIPVSTTFLVLSVFAQKSVVEAMVFKSILGYAVAGVAAFGFWFLLSKLINEHVSMESKRQKRFWRIAQWVSTGFLWSMWLMHDMANISVYLPRVIDFMTMALTMGLLVAFLGYIFYTNGGKIQEIVLSKTGARFIRSATIVNFVFAFILLFFKELNSLPMSTTFVFIGLLAGRELAISYQHKTKKQKSIVFPMLTKDFMKLAVGLGISIMIAYLAGSISM